MMLKKKRTDNEGLDRVHRDVLLAVKVTEDEISAAAGSADLYDGIRLRIAAGKTHRAGDGRPESTRLGQGLTLQGLSLIGSMRWTLTATAILLLAALATWFWLPQRAAEPIGITAGGGVQSGAPSTNQKPEPMQIAGSTPATDTPRRVSRIRRRPASRADEVATEFLPLTYTADPTVPESRHVVHVRIPRSALIAFGFPMNAERAGESIRADVVIGDDGLARAIRFIQ
jgi:hypothetical protein